MIIRGVIIMNELLYKKRDYLCVEIKLPKEVRKDDELKLVDLIIKYNNGYIRYEDPTTKTFGEGLPTILEGKIIFFGIKGGNVESFLKEYNLPFELREREKIIE